MSLKSVWQRTSRTAMWLLPVALLATAAQGVTLPNSGQHEVRNFDARIAANSGFATPVNAAQMEAIEQLRAFAPELAATFEPATGALRTIYNRTGYLTEPNPFADAETIALDWVRQNLAVTGLTERDVESYEVTDNVFNKATGATHLYLRQIAHGLPLYNGQLHVNVNRDGRILSVNNAFLPGLDEAVNVASAGKGLELLPPLGADVAVLRAAEHLGIQLPSLPVVQMIERVADHRTVIDGSGISLSPIEARLMWLPIRAGDARLVWNFQIETLDSKHWYDLTVDATTGQVWTRFDWVNSGSYRVYEQPVEDPGHTTPAPPADARTLSVNPEDATASPSGWFTGGIVDGNNVHACIDAVSNNSCDFQTSCSGTTCDFAIDLNSAPSAYQNAAVANLFYWNNLIHDIQYQYGFDEAGGNFQENNFGNGGAGSDSVNADAQDGGGNCNANFATPTDGGNPRMQMYTCTNVSPARDGDLDNGVIVHEYGHGISIRQVGGPGNSSCLNNNQQAGEGWSDWLALAYTHEPGDAGTDSRGIGTWLFGQAPNGPGIRDLPYSTDPGVNNWTYESISGASIPHGVGSRWAQAAWEVYWALVDQYGFDPDLYNVSAGAGNHRAMLYVNEGLKNTACSPTFVDNRDGIIQAATDNFGGADVCLLWDTFAAFGLGTDAVSGGSNSTNPTNGFQIPIECQCQPNPIADAGPDQNICLGDSATVGTAALPDHTYSWAPGGETTAQISVTPSVDTTYTVTATTTCGSDVDSATIFIDDGSTQPGLDDDFEGDNADWTTSGLWHETVNSSCASPGYSSAVTAFYYGQDSSCSYDTGAANSGSLTSPPISGIDGSSTLTFDYYRVVESYSGGSYDQTTVEILHGGGSTTVFSLDSTDSSTAAWLSSGAISLSAYAGETIQVRFNFDTVDGVSNGFTGWLIDDVVVTGSSDCTPGNTPPTVAISSPAPGSTFTEGDSVSFVGSADDTEDGDITSSLMWSSNLDGTIGSGGSFSTSTLSVGSHIVTASVTDSGGLTGMDTVSITIDPVPNDPPTVAITAPADGSSFNLGDSVTFSGTANDTEDGDISASLSWSSNLDGAIGSGASFSTSALSAGTHTITAAVTDSGGASGSDSITVTIVAPNTAPTVTITAPTDGSAFTEGTSVTFSGTASDSEDGDISANLSWSSSLDGTIGSGASFSTSTLSVGVHTVTASVTDSGGLSGSDQITVTIDVAPPGGSQIWMSFRSNTAVPGVGTVRDEDIVSYDESTGQWAFEFDGSDVGLGGLEISGMAILADGDLLLSFTAAGTVGGMSVDDSDIVRFTPTSMGTSTAGSFSLYFDGSDVGLSSNGEDVTAIALADDGRLIISTLGNPSMNGASGRDEDLFIFTGTLGSSTSGSFAQYFDGSDVGLSNSSSEDIDAASLTNGGNLLFSTVGSFSVSGVSGQDEDVVEFSGTFGTSTSGTFSMRQDLSTLGIASGEDIGSLEIVQ